MDLPELNFPHYHFRFRTAFGNRQIFDEFRKKFVVLTPEEWVRQHVLRWLTEEKGYPSGLLNLEVMLKSGKAVRRSDAVFYNRDATPLLVIECKAPEINISQSVFEQIARYNYSLRATALLVTNGMIHYCCLLDYRKMSYTFLKEVPDWGKLNELNAS